MNFTLKRLLLQGLGWHRAYVTYGAVARVHQSLHPDHPVYPVQDLHRISWM